MSVPDNIRCSSVDGLGGRCKFISGHVGQCHAERTPPSEAAAAGTPSNVDHPTHYNDHPSGVECIDIVEHLPFNVGNAIKYLWRAGLKPTPKLEDLEKARWYVEREIRRLQRPKVTMTSALRDRVRDFLYRLGAQ